MLESTTVVSGQLPACYHVILTLPARYKMETLQIELVNPQAINLLQELATLNLIKIVTEVETSPSAKKIRKNHLIPL
jgi:hypothetical protein